MVDLDAGIPADLDGFDVIVCQRFRGIDLYDAFVTRLAAGGLAVVTVLSETGAASPGPFHAPSGELLRAFTRPDVEIVHHAESDGQESVGPADGRDVDPGSTSSCRAGRRSGIDARVGQARGGGVGEQNVAEALVVGTGLGRAHEVEHGRGEQLRCLDVREVADALEDLQPAVLDQPVRTVRVRHRDHAVLVSPDDHHRDPRGEIEPIARIDLLTTGLDHAAHRAHERLAVLGAGERGVGPPELAEALGADVPPPEESADLGGAFDDRLRDPDRHQVLRTRQREQPQER